MSNLESALLFQLKAVGVDPLWFGVFVVVMSEVALVTPLRDGIEAALPWYLGFFGRAR